MDNYEGYEEWLDEVEPTLPQPIDPELEQLLNDILKD